MPRNSDKRAATDWLQPLHAQVGLGFYVEVLRELGAEQRFWKLRMRPGAPVGFGLLDGLPWIGLPGNALGAGLQKAKSVDVVGIACTDGTVLGSRANVKLRFDQVPDSLAELIGRLIFLRHRRRLADVKKSRTS